MCHPKGYGFCVGFVWKRVQGIDFAYFGLESGMSFKGATGGYERFYRFNSKWIRKKEKYANSNLILSHLFCWRSILSNDDIIR